MEFPNSTDLYLNEDAAEKVGIKFFDNLKSKATKIISKSSL
ncbi:MAG: hypothetical protein RCG15_08610 [Candidatus Rickettsia vulgarisii]